MKKVLIGSPIHQKPSILNEFLKSLSELRMCTLDVYYMFIDDNEFLESSILLNNFANSNDKVVIERINAQDTYICDETTHNWNENLIWKVAEFKNKIINYALENDFDYLFLIDSDLVLHPMTLERLIESGKDIISNIFWTAWNPNTEKEPQVWLFDQYTQFSMKRGEQLSHIEAQARKNFFYNQLKVPGLYEVGGLGACTLISKHALKTGVNFNQIKNVSFWGEDRHFCIRAAALGIDLYVDTHFPAFHIYRESDLLGVSNYKSQYEMVERNYMQLLVLRTVTQGMESLGYFHYKHGNKKEWQLFFEEPLLSALINHSENEYLENVKKRLIVEPQVSDWEILRMDLVDGIAQVKFRLKNTGVENGVSLLDELRCIVNVSRNQEGFWKIKEITELIPVQPVIKPIRRYVKDIGNKLTLSMVVKNEASRYLRPVLEEIRSYIDAAVIIDDESTDNSIEVINEVLGGIPLHVVQNNKSKFANEIDLRKQQWLETVKTNPDWILNLDADEMFEKRFCNEIKKLINQMEVDVYMFRLFDFWNTEYFREDQFWFAHLNYRPILLRYQKDFVYQWKETPQHCGRFPQNIDQLPIAYSDLRLKHFGWARESDRINKYERYIKLDPEFKYGWKEQILSIKDLNPRLVKFVE